jgi:hypothetical protein
VGLTLNLVREDVRAAWAATLGLGWALSERPLPPDLFKHLADTDVEAADLEYWTNSRRR